jgi:hypothetical protein
MAADDRLTGNDGAVSIDTGGTPLVLDITEFDYGERNEHVKGRTAGNRATGRVYTGTDWDANITCRISSTGTTPNLFRRGATVAFLLATDGAVTPAIKVAGSGMCTETRLVGRVENYDEYRMKIECNDPVSLPTITPA